MTDKKEKMMDLDKTTEVLSLKKINDGKEINDLNLKAQHPFEVMLYVNHFKSSEIKVGVDGRVVIVNGHHEARTDAHGFIRRKFSRKYNLPEDIKPENLLAIFKEYGILTIQAYDEKEYKKHEDESDERKNPFETKEFKDGKMFSQKYKGLKNDEVKFIGGVPQLLEKKQSIEDQETKPAKVKPCVTDLVSKSDKSKQTPTASQAEIKTPATVYSPKLDEVKKASCAVKDPKFVVAKQTPASGLSSKFVQTKQTPASGLSSKSVVAKQTPASGLSSKSVQTKQTPTSGLSSKFVQTKQTPASGLSPKSVQTKQTPASFLSPKFVQTKQVPASGFPSKSVQVKQTTTAGQAEVKSIAAFKSPKLVDLKKASGLVKEPKSTEVKAVGEGQASKPGETRSCKKIQASKCHDGKPSSTGQAAKSRRKSDAKSPKSATRPEERWKF